ncbi:MAG: helix-turn-helix domain-containing protein [Alphaproteobacteria bacterium]|nr:helix-turn-helix domain-containing protein [Alphaproteobacteria bacterium]
MLRKKQAASFLGVAPKTLANWRSLGKGPKFCRLGRVIAYRQGDLEAFVEQRLSEPAGPYESNPRGRRAG